jgi:hypothetical protein
MADSATATSSDGWSWDSEQQNVTLGQDGDPNGGFLVAGIGEEGARFATTGNGVTGDVDTEGAELGFGGPADEALVEASADFSAQSGTVSSDAGELFAHFSDGDTFDGSLDSDVTLPGGQTLSTDGSFSRDGAAIDGKGGLALVDGDVTRSATASPAGIVNGVAQTTGDDTVSFREQLGISQALGFARDQTTLGLTRLGNTLGLSGSTSGETGVGRLDASGSASFGEDGSNVFDGKLAFDGAGLDGSIAAHDGGAADRSLTIGTSGDLGDGQPFSTTLGVTETAAGQAAKGGFSAEVVNDLVVSGELGTGPGGETSSLGATLSKEDLEASLAVAGGPDGRTISAGLDVTGEGLAGSLDLMGSAPASGGSTFGLDAEAVMRFTDQLFFGGLASVDAEGDEVSAFAGPTVTFLPSDQVALTAAGGVGTDGPAARLQADLLSQPVDGAQDVLDARGARFGAFVQVGQAPFLDETFGEGDQTLGGANVTTGLNFELPF